jgi:hypothetical protein
MGVGARAAGGHVPIYRLFEGNEFEPEHCQAMGSAFEAVLRELGLTDRNDPICDLVARKIIELGKQGVRDATRLRELAMSDFGPSVSS